MKNANGFSIDSGCAAHSHAVSLTSRLVLHCSSDVFRNKADPGEERTDETGCTGATGGTGLEIVRQAIEHGHSVTALVRSPERLKPFRDHIIVKQGDLLNSAELERVIRGHDAVLSGFGPRLPISKADANLLRDFAVALTTAMQRAGVRRVVVISTAFLFKDSIVPPTYLLGRLFFPRLVVDASAMERVFGESELDWTIVRPPQLTDKPHTGKYRVREGICLASVSIFRERTWPIIFIKTVEDRTSVGKILGASN